VAEVHAADIHAVEEYSAKRIINAQRDALNSSSRGVSDGCQIGVNDCGQNIRIKGSNRR
jgi:hypothetical protein